MAKSYSKRLGEWVEQRSSNKRDRHLVAFLAVRDDIETALGDGYSMKAVWGHLREEERLTIGYDRFRQLVNRYLKGATNGALSAPAKQGVLSAAGVKLQRAKKKEYPQPAGFTFNPVPNKEDLI